jgi:hypothetical protein
MRKFHQFLFVVLFGDLWYLISCNFYFQDFNETAGLVVSEFFVLFFCVWLYLGSLVCEGCGNY